MQFFTGLFMVYFQLFKNNLPYIGSHSFGKDLQVVLDRERCKHQDDLQDTDLQILHLLWLVLVLVSLWWLGRNLLGRYYHEVQPKNH